MTKVLFIQNALYEYFGPMYISAVLKQHGHECDLLVTQEEKNLNQSIKESNPDFLAFSIMSHDHKWAVETATKLKKKFNIPIIFGGAHPTFFPKIIDYPGVDIVCVGEGEYALLDLADKFKKGDIRKIQNLWVKEKKEIFKNPVRPLVDNLDSFPFPDRELYYRRYKFLKEFPTKRFITSRGCPYNCTFCFNHVMRQMYKGKGKPVRIRSPENIVGEINHIRKEYGLKTVRFSDDTFTLNHKWLLEFLDVYKKKVGLPFTCLCRANELNEEVVKKMKEANCASTTFGIETGNEELRNKVLRKNLTDEQIVNAAKLLRKYKLKFGTYNMIGLPGETIEDAFKTIRINAKIKANFPTISIFQPYPETELARYAIHEGMLDENFSIEHLGTMHSALKLKNGKELQNLHKFFYLCVTMPWTMPIVKKLIKLPPNRFFKLIYMASYAHRSLISFRLNPIDALKIGLKMRKSLMTD